MNTVGNQTIEHGFGDIITCKKTNNARVSVMKLETKDRAVV